MEQIINHLIVDDKGFLWWNGCKIPAKLRHDGIEFAEKDPRRAAQAGGDRFVVPFDAFLEIAILVCPAVFLPVDVSAEKEVES